MLKLKTWAYVATLFGGVVLLSGGCGFFGGGSQWSTILAILQEDLFG